MRESSVSASGAEIWRLFGLDGILACQITVNNRDCVTTTELRNCEQSHGCCIKTSQKGTLFEYKSIGSSISHTAESIGP